VLPMACKVVAVIVRSMSYAIHPGNVAACFTHAAIAFSSKSVQVDIDPAPSLLDAPGGTASRMSLEEGHLDVVREDVERHKPSRLR